MLGRLKGVLVVVIGLLLVGLIIYFGWPFLRIEIWGEPADSKPVRWILVAVVLGGWLAFQIVRWLRAKQVGSQLMAAVAKSSPREQPSAEALQLRARFEEAIATLKQPERGRQNLYELPWYVIIGAPGAGKTTVLVNSGLHFPVKQRGKGALRGVGGTRNCDWWFTDEAVFLDTAGRYTTQDSDADSDATAWGEFLALLKKYRPRRPLNGVIVAMSALDLMTQGEAAREEHVTAVRRRIEELNERLGVRLPVYVLITKCDLVAGFSEYFDDLTLEGRSQVWGVTFPVEGAGNAEAAETCPDEFDALMTRLNERVLDRVQDERDPGRRVRAFGFPQQMSQLRGPLTEFVSEVFASTKFERAIQLRGVYFTSGTQEGTPIDRLLGALGRRFGMAPEAVAQGSRGKAYFIERLLKEVLIPESGLAGVNRKLELRKGAAQLAAYVGMAALAVLVVTLLVMKYAWSVSYLDAVDAGVQSVQEVPAVTADASRDQLVRKLDAVRALNDVASAGDLPFYQRWALYSRGSTSEAAETAYAEQVDGLLVPRIKAGLERHIKPGMEPEDVYRHLRAYLALGPERKHLQARFFRGVSWDDAGGAGGEALADHFAWLLEHGGLRRSVELHSDQVTSAQSAIRNASPERLVYEDFVPRYDTPPGEKPLDQELGLGAREVLRTKGGLSLSEPVPVRFTRTVFEKFVGSEIDDLRTFVAGYVDEKWVWGDQGPLHWSVDDITGNVLNRYRDQYIGYWDRVVNDIYLAPMNDTNSLKNGLTTLAGNNSPLKSVQVLVTTHTKLVDTKEEAKGAVEKVKELVGWRAKEAQLRKDITGHFASTHRAVTEIEPLLASLKQLKDLIEKNSGKFGQNKLSPEAQAAAGGMAESLATSAQGLPPSVVALAQQIAAAVGAVMGRKIAINFEGSYNSMVVQECTEHVPGHYPFVKGDTVTSITTADFGDLFGYGGVFDRFEKEVLRMYAEGTPLKWIQGSPVDDPLILKQFDAAREIREAFFASGQKSLLLQFDVQLVHTNLKVRDRNERLFWLDLGGGSDGKALVLDSVPRDPVRVTWPYDPDVAVANWRDSAPLMPQMQDEWAWFRLLDLGDLTPVPDRVAVWKLVLTKDGNTAEIQIDAKKKKNAFAVRNTLARFSCGPRGAASR